MLRENYFIISGCSGGGKSTLLDALDNKAFKCVNEPGRNIVKHQLSIQGNALPWKNLDKFLKIALEQYIKDYKSYLTCKELIFFDRSIVDSVLLNREQDSSFLTSVREYRYNSKVFIVPPWKEIYEVDNERRHSFEEAVDEYNEILIKYKKFGYEVIILPKDTVSNRLDFIEKIIR